MSLQLRREVTKYKYSVKRSRMFTSIRLHKILFGSSLQLQAFILLWASSRFRSCLCYFFSMPVINTNYFLFEI